MKKRTKYILILSLFSALILSILSLFWKEDVLLSNEVSPVTSHVNKSPKSDALTLTESEASVTNTSGISMDKPDQDIEQLSSMVPSTVQDLVNNGLPIMHNARKTSYAQTAEQSTEEVVADLGNVMITMYGYQGRGSGNLYRIRDIGYYAKRIMPNIKIMRLIEEGRKDTSTVSNFLKESVTKCLFDYETARIACYEFLKRGDPLGRTGDNDDYYNKNKKYKCPLMEFQRINRISYMSLYILANIGELESSLLSEWIQKDAPKAFVCSDLDVWLIDAFFRQKTQISSDAAGKHMSLAGGFDIASKKSTESTWDSIWDIKDQMFSMAKINPDDIETIEILRIPRRLPAELDEKVRPQVFENFFEYADQKRK